MEKKLKIIDSIFHDSIFSLYDIMMPKPCSFEVLDDFDIIGEDVSRIAKNQNKIQNPEY